jgi:hypothetical protein
VAKDGVSPVNVSDGFYYVSLLSSIEILLGNEHIFNAVSFKLYTSVS